MEKVKAFVIKHQLWFKLVAIALLICTIFTPLSHIPFYQQFLNYSAWELTKLVKIFSSFINPAEGIQYVFACVSVCLIFSDIALLIVSVFLKNSLILKSTLFIYTLAFITLTLAMIFACVNEQVSKTTIIIPHIAFFLALLLLIIDIITLWQLHKSKRTAERTVE